MTACDVHASGAIELYFYDELDAAERQAVDEHLQSCSHCRIVLADLATIRNALAERPVVSSPPDGDWSGVMSRLDASHAHQPAIPPALPMPARETSRLFWRSSRSPSRSSSDPERCRLHPRPHLSRNVRRHRQRRRIRRRSRP